MLRKIIYIFLLLVLPVALSAQNPLSRKVTLNIERVTLEKALHRISEAGNFYFSYNADILPLDSLVSVRAQQQPVENILRQLIGRNDIRYRAYNTYIIIYQDPQMARASREKVKYTITGYVRDARTGESIPYVSIYETRGENYAITDAEGKYSLTVASTDNNINLGISKRDYMDTVILVRPTQRQTELSVQLLPKKLEIEPLEAQDFERIQYTSTIEEFGLVGFFVPERLQMHAANVMMPAERFAQVSFLPLLGSNGFQSGMVQNRLSLNVVAGYNYGTEGLELGGFLNIDRKRMAGLQIAGFGNFVGGKTYGMQLAGFSNISLRSVYGLQLSGFTNYAQDTVYGIQLAGFNNTLVGKMRGVQISGFNNLATREFDGAQVAGFSNLALKGTARMQAGGFFNYAQKITGLQASGFANVSIRNTYGLQAAGFANYSRNMYGLQAGGVMNITSGTLYGLQAGLINYATKVKGVQLGIINIADSVKGIPIGLFSYIHHGYRHFQLGINENGLAQVQFKTGVPYFYNIFTGGFLYQGHESLWNLGYGIGTSTMIGGKVEINLDVTANTFWVVDGAKTYNILGQADLQFAYHFGKYFSIFLGPSFNTFAYYSDDHNLPSAITDHPPYVQYEHTYNNISLKSWLGWKAGVRF